MRFFISYFYQVRFFNRNTICFSTAVWDPKWFHDFEGQDNVFKDKHQVYNGIRAEMLHPLPTNTECLDCQSNKDPSKCSFIKNYKKQLHSLSFQEVIDFLKDTALNIFNYENIQGEPDIVLLVHEAPNNICSERWALIEWFKENGIDLQEWKKE